MSAAPLARAPEPELMDDREQALARLNDEEMLYLRFTIGGDTGESQAAMENRCEQILASVRPNATPAP